MWIVKMGEKFSQSIGRLRAGRRHQDCPSDDDRRVPAVIVHSRQDGA